MEPNAPDLSLAPDIWAAALARAQSSPDALEDGAFVRTEDGPVLVFYASELNTPEGWRFPFLEPVPGTARAGAMVGQVQFDPSQNVAVLTPTVYAAVQAVTADYESDAGDMDYVAYENAAQDALNGTPADAAWLFAEWTRLLRLAGA